MFFSSLFLLRAEQDMTISRISLTIAKRIEIHCFSFFVVKDSLDMETSFSFSFSFHFFFFLNIDESFLLVTSNTFFGWLIFQPFAGDTFEKCS